MTPGGKRKNTGRVLVIHARRMTHCPFSIISVNCSWRKLMYSWQDLCRSLWIGRKLYWGTSIFLVRGACHGDVKGIAQWNNIRFANLTAAAASYHKLCIHLAHWKFQPLWERKEQHKAGQKMTNTIKVVTEWWEVRGNIGLLTGIGIEFMNQPWKPLPLTP